MSKNKELIVEALRTVFSSVEISRNPSSAKFYTATVERQDAPQMPDSLDWRGPVVVGGNLIFMVKLKEKSE